MLPDTARELAEGTALSAGFDRMCQREAGRYADLITASGKVELGNTLALSEAPEILRDMGGIRSGVYAIFAYPDAHAYEADPAWAEHVLQNDGRNATAQRIFQDADDSRSSAPGGRRLKYIGSHADLPQRAHEHYESVRDAGGLVVGRFEIEVYPLAPVLSGLVECELIARAQPPWNGPSSSPSRTSPGFGYDRKSQGRQEVSISPWDAVYPVGRLRRQCYGRYCKDAGKKGIHPLIEFDGEWRVWEMILSGMSLETVRGAIVRGELVCDRCR